MEKMEKIMPNKKNTLINLNYTNIQIYKYTNIQIYKYYFIYLILTCTFSVILSSIVSFISISPSNHSPSPRLSLT